MAQQRFTTQLRHLSPGAVPGCGSRCAGNGKLATDAVPQLPRARRWKGRCGLVQHRTDDACERGADETRSAGSPVKKWHASKQQASKDVRNDWLAELSELPTAYASLVKQARTARRKGNLAKVQLVENKMRQLLAPYFLRHLPDLPNRIRLKALPRKLRSRGISGRAAWQTLYEWDARSKDEKAQVWETLSKMPGWRKWRPMLRIVTAMRDRDAEFFHSLGIAFAESEEHANAMSLRPVKARLLEYRWSLECSKTPGQPRHTPKQIKQIVAPKSSVTDQAFLNLINQFRIPHLTTRKPNKSNQVRIGVM